jgi:hypothetical protein
MAGGNKSNSPKFKKRQAQQRAAEQAKRQAAKKRYGNNER